METIEELYAYAQAEFDIFVRQPDLNKNQVLESIFKTYRIFIAVNRKLELLKQFALEKDITGISKENDVCLYNSSSASFEYNDWDLSQDLEELEKKVKDLKILLKSKPSTVKTNKKTIALKAINKQT